MFKLLNLLVELFVIQYGRLILKINQVHYQSWLINQNLSSNDYDQKLLSQKSIISLHLHKRVYPSFDKKALTIKSQSL